MHELIKPAITKYLEDNGAAEVCKTHIDKLTQAVVDSLPTPVPATIQWTRAKAIVTVSTRTLAGQLEYAESKLKQQTGFLILDVQEQTNEEGNKS